MPEPSIIIDLFLRDVPAERVEAIASNLRAQLTKALTIDIPAAPGAAALQQTEKATRAISQAAGEAKEKLLSIADVYKDPSLLSTFVAQQRDLLALKADAEKGISKAATPREFLTNKDVIRDQENYNTLLQQQIELEKLRTRLRADVRAAVPKLTEADASAGEQAKIDALHARALADNVKYDKRRLANAEKSGKELVSVEAQVQAELDKLRRKVLVNQQLTKDPVYIEQQRALLALKGETERGVSKASSPREFLSMKDVLRDQQNYNALLQQQIQLETTRRQLRSDVRAALPKLTEAEARVKEQATIETLHARALVENEKFDQRRLKAKQRASKQELTVEEQALSEIDRLRKKAAVNQQIYNRLTSQERDAFGKRLGRTPYSIEHPFDFFSAEGAKNRVTSLFAGQVGSLVVYGAAIRGVSELVNGFISTNTELEDSLARVSTIIDGQGEQFKRQYNELREEAIAWGRQHAQSAKDASDAMYFLLSAGQSVEEVQRNLPSVLRLSYGGYIDAAFAAETVSTAYELFRKDGEDVVDIVNKIQRTNEVSQVTVEQYAAAFTYLASTADQAKISFDDVSAAIGTLGTLGLRGSKGGRNLDEAIGQLLKKQGQLREMGVDIRNSAGDLKSFGEILEEFRKKLGSKIDVEELKVLRDIFGQQGGRAFGLLIENTDLYLDNLEKIKESEGEIYDAAFKRGETLSQLWERFKNQLAGVAQEGNAVIDVLKAMVAGSPTERQVDFLKPLLTGAEGSRGVQFAMDTLRQQTNEKFLEMVSQLRGELKGKIDLGALAFDPESTIDPAEAASELLQDPARLNALRDNVIAFLKRSVDEINQDEEVRRNREIVAGGLHLQAGKLEPLVFSSGDVAAIKKNAREYFTQLRASLVASLNEEVERIEREGAPDKDIKIQVRSKAFAERIGPVTNILGGLLDDTSFDAPTSKIKTFFADLKIAISQAQLDVLRSLRPDSLRTQLQVIDTELLVNLEKNRHEYTKQLDGLDDDLKNDTAKFAAAKRDLKRVLELKDIADINKAATQIVRVQFEVEFGDAHIAKLKKELARAQIELGKAVPEHLLPLRSRLELIDSQTLLGLERNKQEYLDKLKSLPDEIALRGQNIGSIRGKIVSALDSISDGVGGSAEDLAATATEVRNSLVVLAASLPIDDSSFELLRKKIVAQVQGMATEVPSSFEVLKKNVLALLDTLPADLTSRSGRLKEVMDVLQDTLTVKDQTERNKAFFAKDQLIRDEMIRAMESQAQREQHLQEVLLDQQEASDFRRVESRNTLLRDLLVRELPALVPTTTIDPFVLAQIEIVDDFGKKIESLTDRTDAIREVQGLLLGFDIGDASAESLAKLENSIRSTLEQMDVAPAIIDAILDKLNDFDIKAITTTDYVHAFGDAIGSLSGAMEELGNSDTWQKVSRGVGVAESSITKLLSSLELLKSDKPGAGLLGGLGIFSAAFSIIGFLGSLLSQSEERANTIGIEEYKYESGKNVSANYGRAQTINVQVDLNPNFNFLDASQLTQQRQREMAFALGDEIDNYFEETGRFKRN